MNDARRRAHADSLARSCASRYDGVFTSQTDTMRRWILILLLIVYPFQVALSMADRCCVMTSSGLTHHSAEQGQGNAAAEPVFLVDDDSTALVDPHCAACSFAHHFYLPSDALVLPPQRHDSMRIDAASPFRTSPPVRRLERPKWSAAA